MSAAMALFRAERPEDGADELVWLAEGRPGVDWESGEFYVKRKTGTRLNPLANDVGLAEALWKRSEQLLDQARLR